MEKLTKFLIIILAFTSLNSFAFNREGWQNANTAHKVQLLKEYKAFFEKLNLSQELSEFEQQKITFFSLLMSEAWAAGDLNCIYAGWPSKRVNNLCSSPQKHNPDYQKGTCGQSEMQCQPLLFGPGNCVPVSTQEQRSMAFSNCDKKSNKDPEVLIKEIKAAGLEPALFELMDFADKICKEGKQAGTAMCKRLVAAVGRMRHFQPTSSVKISSNESKNNLMPVAEIDGKKLILTVSKAEETLANLGPENKCEIEVDGTPFDREVPRPFEFEYLTSKQGEDPAWEDTFLKDKREEALRPNGFQFFNIGPNAIAGQPIDPELEVEREWSFVTEDNSRRESYLWLTDDAGSGFLSQRMESIIMIVPRKMKPSIEAMGEELHVTLTTGEKVIYDKKTKVIKAGVLKEGKVDLNPDRFNRKFAPITYEGTGISIRVNKRGEDPRLIPGNAVVTQNGKTCQVPARELWNAEVDFKYASDQGLVEYLNRKCGNKFNL